MKNTKTDVVEQFTNIIISHKNREYIRRLKKAYALENGITRLSYYDLFNLIEKNYPNENDLVKKIIKKS